MNLSEIMKGRLRLRKITPLTSAAPFVSIETVDGERVDMPPAHTEEVQTTDGPRKRATLFCPDTPHNRVFNLKACAEVAVVADGRWRSLTQADVDPLFAPADAVAAGKKAPEATAPQTPVEAEETEAGESTAVVATAADLARLSPAEQLAAVGAAECPEGLLRQVAAAKTKGVAAATVKAARARLEAGE